MTNILLGPQGPLEILFSQPAAGLRPGIGLICHPHPLFDGNMHNKVVYTLAKAFEELGLKSLRFNYRGVGQSAGAYGEGLGESEDALFLYDWLSHTYPGEPIYLAGFSFGGYVAAKVASARPVQGLITIAPSAEHFDWTPLSITCPWLLIQSQDDDIVSPAAVEKLRHQFAATPDFVLLEEGGHFFHGKLNILRQRVVQWLSRPSP